jgi:hypothetical protein
MNHPELEARAIELELFEISPDAGQAFMHGRRGIIPKDEAIRRIKAVGAPEAVKAALAILADCDDSEFDSERSKLFRRYLRPN